MAISTATCRCGASLPADAPWCPRCLEPVAETPVVPASSAAFDPAAAGRPAPVIRETKPTGRFAKTEVSFGLTGRIVLTVLLLIPAVWFAFLAKELFSIGGLVLWMGVVMPWALRDLWRHPRRNR